MNKSIIWIASFPRSGNTWMRILLTNYILNTDSPVDINQLYTHGAADRGLFWKYLGIDSARLTESEAASLRASVYDRFSQDGAQAHTDQGFRFVKVHDAYGYYDGIPMFPSHASMGVIYLIRNPFDVAVSYAQFQGESIEEAVRRVTDYVKLDATRDQLSQYCLTWANHVNSWTLQNDIPVHVVRYEDLKTQPESTFASVIRFCRFEVDPQRIRKAIKFSSFDIVSQQEKHSGFVEKPLSTKRFFYRGEIGMGHQKLDDNQLIAIENATREVIDKYYQYK